MTEFISSTLDFLNELGYFGIALGLMIEVIPSEIVLSWAGYMIQRGDVSYWTALIAAVVGGTLAQLFLYWLGKYGGRPVVEKYGKYLLIKPKHLEMSERLFKRYGTIVIFTARFIPVVRHAISIPAGMAHMSWQRFTIYTTLAVIPWSVFFIWIGYSLGENWKSVDEHAGPDVLPVIWTAIIITVVYIAWKFLRDYRKWKKQ